MFWISFSKFQFLLCILIINDITLTNSQGKQIIIIIIIFFVIIIIIIIINEKINYLTV